MALEDILDRVKAINGGIIGVTTAFTYNDIPENLSTADLPAAVPYPHRGDLVHSAKSRVGRIDHEIKIRLYVKPTGQATLAQNLRNCVPFVTRFRDEYAAALKLNDLAGVERAHLMDYRVGLLPDYAGQEYVGVEFTLRVLEIESVTAGT